MSRLTLCIVLLAAMTAACGSSPTTATPDPVPITDVYEGTLNPNGANRYSFVTSRAGTLTATLSALTPPESIVGLALGTFNSTTGLCQVVLANDKATLTTFVDGNSDRAGNLCVRIYDVGTLTDPVDYQIQVVHF
jgi:hypothetical protein